MAACGLSLRTTVGEVGHHHALEDFKLHSVIMASLICPNCAHTQQAPDAYIGRTARCVKCDAQAVITSSTPKPSPSAAPVPTPIFVPPAKPEFNAEPHRLEPALSRVHVRIIIGLLSFMLAAQLYGWTSTKSSGTKWEYWVESPEDEILNGRLSILGSAGWELVFARRASNEDKAQYEMVFKRPRP